MLMHFSLALRCFNSVQSNRRAAADNNISFYCALISAAANITYKTELYN